MRFEVTEQTLFSEKYIDKNVKIDDDGLGTIILLGGQVDLQRDYQKQIQKREAAKSNLAAKQNQHNQTVNHLKILRQQKAKIGFAVNSINNSLDYVFFARGRLSIELKNEKYYLKSNGKDVKPKDVSLGERNIIALCYFFYRNSLEPRCGKAISR